MKRPLLPLLAAALLAAAASAPAGARPNTAVGTVFRDPNHVKALAVEGGRLTGLTASGHRWAIAAGELRRVFDQPSVAPALDWLDGPVAAPPVSRGLRWSGQAGGYPVTDGVSYRGRTIRSTFGGGLFVGEARVGEGPREVYDLALFAGLLAVAHAGGLALYDGTSLVELRLPGPPDDNVSALAWLDGALYVGYFDAGLACLRDGRWRRVKLPDRTAAGWINALVVDGDDLWVGGAFGLGRLDPVANAVRAEPGFSQPILGLRNDGGRLVATGAHAVWVRSEDGWQKTDLPGEALHTALVHDGELWAAGMRGVLRRHRGSWRRYSELDGSLPHGWVTALLPVNGRMWVGTYDAGLVALAERGPGRTLRDEAWVNPNALVEYPRGVAVGTMGDGLLLYDGAARRWRRLKELDGLPSDDVTAVIAVGADLWVGTRGGLIHLSDATVPRIDRAER